MSSARWGIRAGWRMAMFAKPHAERGKRLFRVAADKQPQPVVLWIVGLALAIVYAVALKGHPGHWGWVIFYVCLALLQFLLSGKVAFYENGVYFSQDPSARGRFLSWPEIERFYWEGDVLIIVPRAPAVLSASGIREPVLGGRIKIPPARRTLAENLLASKLPRGSEPGK